MAQSGKDQDNKRTPTSEADRLAQKEADDFDDFVAAGEPEGKTPTSSQSETNPEVSVKWDTLKKAKAKRKEKASQPVKPTPDSSSMHVYDPAQQITIPENESGYDFYISSKDQPRYPAEATPVSEVDQATPTEPAVKAKTSPKADATAPQDTKTLDDKAEIVDTWSPKKRVADTWSSEKKLEANWFPGRVRNQADFYKKGDWSNYSPTKPWCGLKIVSVETPTTFILKRVAQKTGAAGKDSDTPKEINPLKIFPTEDCSLLVEKYDAILDAADAQIENFNTIMAYLRASATKSNLYDIKAALELTVEDMEDCFAAPIVEAILKSDLYANVIGTFNAIEDQISDILLGDLNNGELLELGGHQFYSIGTERGSQYFTAIDEKLLNDKGNDIIFKIIKHYDLNEDQFKGILNRFTEKLKETGVENDRA